MTGHHLGVMEPLLILNDQADVAERIAHITGLSVIVDANAGFGDPVHIARCVREFARAGIAAIHIEDQLYPKRLSYHEGREFVVPREEFFDKVKAALDARSNSSLLLIARTDAWDAVNGSPDEGVERAQELVQLGVVIIFPHSDSRSTLATYREQVPDIPMMALLASLTAKAQAFDFIDSEDLFELGYALQIFTASYGVSMAPVISVYQTLISSGRFSFEVNLTAEDIIHARDWLNDDWS